MWKEKGACAIYAKERRRIGKKEKRKREEEGEEKNWRKEGSSNSQYAGMTPRLA